MNACPNVGWIRDFADPQTVLDVAFNGNYIFPENNPNWPQLNDPAINRAMARARADSRHAGAREGVGGHRSHGRRDRRRDPVAVGQESRTLRGRRALRPELWNQGHCDFSYTSLK